MNRREEAARRVKESADRQKEREEILARQAAEDERVMREKLEKVKLRDQERATALELQRLQRQEVATKSKEKFHDTLISVHENRKAIEQEKAAKLEEKKIRAAERLAAIEAIKADEESRRKDVEAKRKEKTEEVLRHNKE